MGAQIVQLATVLAIANTVAALVMVPLAFLVSSIALNYLEQFDLWIRRRDEKRTLRKNI